MDSLTLSASHMGNVVVQQPDTKNHLGSGNSQNPLAPAAAMIL